MPADKKIIERVEKLMRLAAPTSGSSEHERSSAALEAARLFSEHDLVARERPAKRRAARHRDSAPPNTPTSSPLWPSPASSGPASSPYAPNMNWIRGTAAHDAVCADPSCQDEICRGDKVWRRINGFKVEYMHIDGPCGW